MNSYKHSVSLDVEKCKGCTDCLKRCPTEAIRIRNGHACIDPERCIDCGECIRVCKNKAKHAVCDKLSMIPKDKWTVALPAPTLYGQFDNLDDIDYVLQGLLDYGFDDVYEVACAAEIVSDYTRKYLKTPNLQKPIISSACPVITRLISLRYPFLCDNLLPLLPPIEVAAAEARKRALEKNPHLTRDDVCIVFISPCPAKASYVKNREEKSEVDLVVSMRDIYFELLNVMTKEKTPAPFSRSGIVGISWASSGGECTAVFSDRFLAADGIENVLNVLEEIDNGTFPDLEFVELNACQGGCVGGSLTVTNPYIAKARLQTLRRYLPVSQNWAGGTGDVPPEALTDTPVEYVPPRSLSEDRAEAMRMMQEISDLAKTLPGIDCGSCGAPTCIAFAEDVIRGECSKEDCLIRMRELFRRDRNSGGDNHDS